MSTSVEHPGLDIEPVVDTRWHRTLLSLGIGLMVAAFTLLYVYLETLSRDPNLFWSIAPFIVIASVAGVGLPSYLATDMIHRHTWLQAAGASCLVLFMGFIIFWSSAVVATTGPSEVRVGAVPVLVTIKYDRSVWRSDVSARLAMANDLCVSNCLRGLSPEQVRAELGEPIRTVGPGVREMCYALTPTAEQTAEAQAKAEAMLLRVLFSSQGRVASVALGGAN